MAQVLAGSTLFCYQSHSRLRFGTIYRRKTGRSSRANRQDQAILEKPLGSLELEVMELLWRADEATVRQITERINLERPVAYTTVMTVMGHLVNKGLLTRVMEHKRYRYRVINTREDLLQEACRTQVRSLLDDFGDLAIAGFLGEVDKVTSDRLEQLRRLAQEASGGRDTTR